MIALVLLATLHAGGGFFRDAQGGTVILRGVNVTGDAKLPPFQTVTDASLLDPLPQWGVNVIRLLFIWEAYEPQPGAYDQGYLDYYTGVVRAAAERGIYVLVDFHQDAYSRFSASGCGEGFPAWTLPPSVSAVTPDNGPSCADWGRKMVGDANLTTTWNAFYADTNGVRTRWLQMIGRVAAALKDEPGVIGYDLLNEPGGDEKTQMGPLYEDAARAIRAADSDAILFVESSAIINSAAHKTQVPRPTFDNFAYAPHFYDPIVVLAHAWTGAGENDVFANMRDQAAAWNAPLFLGEYGAPPSTDMLAGYMDTLRAQLDLALASGTQWAYTPGWTAEKKDGWNTEDFSIVDGSGALRANFVPHPYPRRLSGTPIAITVGAESLDVIFDNDPTAGSSELFVPASWSVSIDDGSCTAARCTSTGPGTRHIHAGPKPSCGLTGAEGFLLLLMCTRLRRRSSRSGSSCSRRRSSADRSADRRTSASTW